MARRFESRRWRPARFCEIEMKISDFAKDIIERFGTSDVFQIAEKVGVKIFYESWNPVTIGEFDWKTKTICVNLRALKNDGDIMRLEKLIVAHELGHFFAADLKLEKSEEEKFAREFAETLIGKENKNGA